MNFFKFSALWLALIYLSCQQLQGIFALQCYTCDDGSEKKCPNEVAKTEAVECGSSICFTKTVDGKVNRGCRESNDISSCEPPNCYKCQEDDKCNKHTICKSCNSTVDPNCAQTNVADVKYNQVCSLENVNCIVQVSDDGNTLRGCANAIDKQTCDSKNGTCKACTDTSLCNEGIFPETRIQCYECNGASCNDVSSLSAKPCHNFAKADKCFTYGESSEKMQRGCQSDTAADKCKLGSENAECHTCAENGCNKLQYERKATLSCIKCNSTADPKCEEAQSTEKAESCADLKYNQEDACYMQDTKGTIYRGCYNERNATTLGDCNDANGCSKCTDAKGCNSKEAVFTCIRCRSDLNKDCWDNADKIEGSKCTNDGGRASGCYHGVWYDVVIRGCMVDADVRMQYQCNNPADKSCIACTTSANCNVNKTSGAATLSGISGLIGLLIICLRQFM